MAVMKFFFVTLIFTIVSISENSGLSNETLALSSEALNHNNDPSSLLSVVLVLSCVLSLSILTSFYLEVGKKATEASNSKGVFLVLACSTTFTSSNALQKFGYFSCAPWQLLVMRGILQIVIMLICRCLYLIKEIRNKSATDAARHESGDTSIRDVENGDKESVTNHDQLNENSYSMKNTGEWVVWFLLGPALQGARKLVLLQGIFGAMILFGIFTSLHFIPAAEATAIFFMIPIFSFSLSVFMLKERFTILRFIISLISIVGVLLVVRPKVIFGTEDSGLDKSHHAFFLSPIHDNETISIYESVSYHNHVNESSHVVDIGDPGETQWTNLIIGYISALLVPISVSLCTIVTRQLAIISPQTLDVPLLMMWQGVGSALIGLVSYLAFNAEIFDDILSIPAMSEIIAIIILGMMGNILIAMAVKFISPSLMNVIRCIEVVFMFIIQMELSESKEHKVFHIEHGIGILSLFLTALLICKESDIRSRFKFL